MSYQSGTGLGVAPGVISAGVEFTSKILGGIFGGKPQWLKDYFNGHEDKYENRYKWETAYRWHVMPYDSLPGWASTADGQSEIQQIAPGGTLADAYLILFVYGKNLTGTNLRKFKNWVAAGQLGFKSNPASVQKITMFKLVNDQIVYTGGNSAASVVAPTTVPTTSSYTVPSTAAAAPMQAGLGFDLDATTIGIIAAVGLGLYYATKGKG